MLTSTPFNQLLLARCITAGDVVWHFHAQQRAVERGFAIAAVLTAIRTGEVIEDYSAERPRPTALVLGKIAGRVLHAVVALDAAAEEAYIITLYEPDDTRFEPPDFRTRKQP